jgi:hypothetical protein
MIKITSFRARRHVGVVNDKKLKTIDMRFQHIVINLVYSHFYEGVSKSFRAGRLERELQMVEFSATR